MNWLIHFLFGCDRDVQVGYGPAGTVRKCSYCEQAWLVPFRKVDGEPRKISKQEADDYAEHFES